MEALIPSAFEGLFVPARHKAYFGGRGSAKSHSFASALVIRAAESTKRILGLREIQKSIKDSAKLLIEDKIKDLGLQDRFECLDTEIRGTRNDSRITFAGLRTNPEALKSSEGVDIAAVFEANQASSRSIDMLVPTIRKDNSELWWEWNPEFEHDPVDKMFRRTPPPDSIVKRVTWRDNPWFPSVLRVELEHMKATDPIKYEHVWEGEYVKAIEGAYFAKELRAARDEGRFGRLARDPNMQIRSFWDLGRRDATAIWVAQFVGREIRVLDYIEGERQAPGYYFEILREKRYSRSLCVFPHDGAAVHPENPTGTSYSEQAQQAGFDTQVVRNQGQAAAMLRVNAARRVFPFMWFDEDATRAGINTLGAYHERRDDKRNVGLGPEHDWASHCGDAFGLMAIAYEEPMQDNDDDWSGARVTANSRTGY